MQGTAMKPQTPKDWCNTAMVIAVALGLAACGGGDAPVLRGTAATGAPLVDAQVSLVCASGPVLTTRTNTAGDWQLTLSAQRAPCAAQVNADPLVNGLRYHALSASTDGGVLNITPLTDLVVTRLIGAEPTAWFATLSPRRCACTRTASASKPHKPRCSMHWACKALMRSTSWAAPSRPNQGIWQMTC